MKHSFKRLSVALVLAGATLGGLTACFPLLMGGAVMGTLVATDRRTSGTVVEDEGIEIKAANRLRENLGERVNVSVTSYNRQALITGEVPTAQDKALVEKVVAGVENVRNVVNEVAIMGNSTLTQRSSDSLVTGRVKAGLVDAKDLFANSFKIRTEHGVTYIMGRVTQREANRATEVITATPGVQRLVRVLEIISEEELTRMLPQPSNPPQSANPSY
jgi:osmotically-inducible protein OsmY